MKKSTQKKSGSLSRRVHFPEDEARLPWLPMLLDAYAVADTGVAIAIRDEEKKRKKKLACGKGCGNCCAHQKDLPLYPHELVGIYWYVSEKMVPDVIRAGVPVLTHLEIKTKLGGRFNATQVVVTIADPDGNATGQTAVMHGDEAGHYMFRHTFARPGRHIVRIFPSDTEAMSTFELDVEP